MSWDESGSRSSLNQRWQMRVLVICAAAALVTGTVGFLRLGEPPFPAVYQTLQMFFLESLDLSVKIPPESPASSVSHVDPVPKVSQNPGVPLLIEVARWLAAASVLLAVCKLGGSLFRDELTGFRLRCMRRHTILCGLGQKTMALIEHLRAAGEKVVVVDKMPPPDLVQDCRHVHAQVLVGDATDQAILRLAGVERASQVFALCPEDNTNCEIAAQVRRVRDQADHSSEVKPLLCHVHLSDMDLRSALQPVFAKGAGGVTLRFLDLFDLEARRLLGGHLPLDGPGLAADDPRQAHLVILGFGRMGRALAIRSAQVGHFANGKRLRISVIDSNAERQEAALLFRYPRFTEICDLEFHALKVETPQAHQLLEQWCVDPGAVVSVAICFDNEPRALEMALQWQTLLRDGRVRIAIRMARQSGLARLLQEQQQVGGEGPLLPIQPFGMYEDCCHPEFLTDGTEDRLAQWIHRDFVHRRRQQEVSSQTNPALLPWDDLDEDFRESNRQQAAHIYVKLRAIGCRIVERTDPCPEVTIFTPDEIELLARMEHTRWMAERILAGWTHAPDPKDITRKTSPYLVPWEELAPEIQQYDRDFVVLIPTLLAADHKKICRQESPCND